MRVFGSLGIKDREVVMKIAERLEDKDSDVREAAVKALGELGIRDGDVAMKIVERLEDAVSDVRVAAVEALGKIGIRDSDVAMKIVEKLEHKDSDVRYAAVRVFGSLGIKDREVVMKIAERLEDEDSDVREAAVYALGKLGIKDRDVAMKIVEKLEDEDPWVRYEAELALYELSDEPEVIEKAIQIWAGQEWKQKLNYKLQHSKLGKFMRKILKIKQVKLPSLYAFLKKLAILRCRKSVEAFIGWWKESLTETPVKRCLKETFPNILKEIKEWTREFIIAILTGGAVLKFGPFERLSGKQRAFLFGLIIVIMMFILNMIEFAVCLSREKQKKK